MSARSLAGTAPAWAVHLYTALGAPLALAAMLAVIEGDVRRAFLWMSATVFIDATDGALARAVDVKRRIPWFDGARLDDVMDYLNYVVVPAFAVLHWGLVSSEAQVVVAAPLVASAYGFCRADAKTADHFFTGFPSYWNIVVLYMVALETSPATNAMVLSGLAVLVFVPVRYLYPSRTRRLRPLTVTLGAVWAVVTIAMVLAMPSPPAPLVWASLAYPVYYFGLSLWFEIERWSGGDA